MYEMKDIHGITNSVGKSREHFLLATVSSIIRNVSNFSWTILVQEPLTPFIRDVIIELGKYNNNLISIIGVDSSFSVGQMKAYYVENFINSTEYLMNIDDDFIFSSDTVELISKSVYDKPLYTYGNWDIFNTRQYKDWDKIVRSSDELPDFIEKNTKRCVPYHLWDKELRLLKTDKMVAGAYIVKLSALKECGIIELWKTFEKGVRGYDTALENYFKDIYHIFSATIVHIGVDDGYFNDRFQSDSEFCGREL